MEAATTTTGKDAIGRGGEPIESIAWVREFGERYLAAWNSRDPDAVTAYVHADVTWVDPALEEPARGRAGVADFVRSGAVAFPDMAFTELGEPAINDDRGAAYMPWRMRGTNAGPIDPPGLAPTGRRLDLRGFDVWVFRDGLIWDYEAFYDFADMSRQLGLMPPRGGSAERAMLRMQRLRAKLPF